MGDPCRMYLESENLPNGAVEVSRAASKEAISRLFEIELFAVCEGPEGLSGDDLVGQPATLVLLRDGLEERRICGIVSVLQDRLEVESVTSTYRLVLVPRAHRMALVEQQRVYLDASVPDIVRMKLADAGLVEGEDFELRLLEQYPARELVVQYKESDLAFVSRLTEHLGISFFFEHASGRDVMVFTDYNGGFRPLEPRSALPFRSRGEARDVFELSETVTMIPGQFVVRDYNYRTPLVTLTGQAALASGDGTIIEYGSHVKTPDEASQLARIRAQERLASRRVFEGRSDVMTMAPGVTFVLEDHPRGDLHLLVTEVSSSASQATVGASAGDVAGYKNQFKAVLEARTYRPARVTPRPRIHGVVTGVIDAAQAGQYAELDEEGRYRVRFMFDTTTEKGTTASRLVRMAQLHSGAGYGMHFPLRSGVEVLLAFVDGDPDRPIITGTVPNPQTASPVAAGNAPRNVIRTGGGNEINIDDTEDSQRIKLTTPHKSTTFQLGYRNSPEDGAILETQGASSTVAFSGTAAFSSSRSTISALKDFRSSGSVSSIAEPPDFLTKATAVNELIAHLVDTTGAIIEAIEARHKADEAVSKADALKAQLELKAKEDDLKARQAAVRAAEEALFARLGEAGTGLAAKKAAYEAAEIRYKEDRIKLFVTREWLRDAEKAQRTGAGIVGVDMQLSGVAEGQRAIDGDPAGTTPAAKAGSRKTWEDARADYLASLKQQLIAGGMSPADAKTALDALGDAQQDVKSAEAASDAAFDEADRRKRSYDELTEEHEFGESGIALRKAKLAVAYAKTGRILFSEVMAAVTIVKELRERKNHTSKKAEASVTVVMANGRESPPPTFFGPPALVTHTVGSRRNTVVYGEDELFAWSDKASLVGKNAALVASDTKLSLLSAGDAELAAQGTAFITATILDVRADGAVQIKADPRIPGAGAGTVSIESRGAMDLESTRGAMSLTARTSLSGEAREVHFTASKKSDFIAGPVASPWGLTVDGSAGQVKLGGAAWKLEIKNNDVKLGGGDSGLSIKPAATTLESGATMARLSPTQALIKSTKVQLVGTEIRANGRCLLG